jgi:hypothetical protein
MPRDGTVQRTRVQRTRGEKSSDDRGVALYHVVLPHEGFEDAARALFRLVRRAQDVKPGARRMLFLDIEGHRQPDGSFDADMRELQQEFLFDVLARFLTEAHCPLMTLRNPHPQDDDLPEDLIIEPGPRTRS